MGNSSQYLKSLMLLGLVSIIFITFLFFFKFNEQNSITGNAITGMTVGGFSEVTTEGVPLAREILINPKLGKVLTGDKFTVDIVSYPKSADTTKIVKYYKIKVRFDNTKLIYTEKSAKSLLNGWSITESITASSTGTTKTLIIEGNIDTSKGVSASSSAPIDLVELGFTAASGIKADISSTILFMSIELRDKKGGTLISDAITKKTSSTITITAPVDNDGDGYSSPQDCDDDTSDDGYYPSLCPDTVADCYEQISVATIPTKYQINLPLLESTGTVDIVSQKNKFCSICKNPGISVDYCDGIDNDCDGVVDGKTTMYENCPSGACASQSTSSSCASEICDNNLDDDGDGKIDALDCDCSSSSPTAQDCTVVQQKLDTCINSLPTCNAVDCLNTIGVGGTSAGCDEKGFCITTGENCAEKTDNSIDFTVIGGKTINYKKQTCNTAGTHKLIYSCKSTDSGALTNVGVQKVACLLGCKNDDCVTACSSASCPTCSTCPSTPITSTTPTVSTVFTPACGKDGDNDGNLCDTFENYLTCSQDCIKEDICNPAKPNGNTNYCLIDTNGDGAYDNDLDKDGLSNEYEVYLEVNVPLPTKSQTNYKGWYDINNPDTDGDGVFDDKDYCPGTDTQSDKLTLTTGHINFNGCYVGDVGQQKKDILNPDGCFSQADTKFLISYYKSIVKGESCLNIYGEDIKK